MLTQIENKSGIISYDNSLMDQIMEEAISPFTTDCKLIKKIYYMHTEGVVVDLSFAIRFGTSIKAFTNQIISTTLKRIEDNLELPVKRIRIDIVSVYSKKYSKRDIRIEYNYKSGITDNRN